MRPGRTLSYLTPEAGTMRLLDAAVNEYQGGQDFIGAWDPASGQQRAGFPAPVNDLQFLTGPVIGRVVPGPGQQVIGGTASLDLQAFDAAGAPASPAWPKLTGDWTLASPLLGSFGSSPRRTVVSITRSGTLTVYATRVSACAPADWPRFHHDNWNSGDLSTVTTLPGAPVAPTRHGQTLTFTAPGAQLLCGIPSAYQVATSSRPIDPAGFARARPVAATRIGRAAAGSRQTLILEGRLERYVAVRALFAPHAGTINVGPPAEVGAAA